MLKFYYSFFFLIFLYDIIIIIGYNYNHIVLEN